LLFFSAARCEEENFIRKALLAGQASLVVLVERRGIQVEESVLIINQYKQVNATQSINIRWSFFPIKLLKLLIKRLERGRHIANSNCCQDVNGLD